MECAQKQYHHEVYANDIDLMVNHLRAALRAAFFVKKTNKKKEWIEKDSKQNIIKYKYTL